MPLNQSTIIHDALQIESLFAANSYQGDMANPPVSIIRGKVPIVIAAPHAVEHPRHGLNKKADMLTGTIASQVAEATGCFAVILSQTNQEDPNHDPSGPFKRCLQRLTHQHNIQVVINVHGMVQSHPWDLVFGSNYGKSLGGNSAILPCTISALREAGLTKVLVDSKDLFAASNTNNISVYAWEELGVPAFQIEINRSYRDPLRAPDKYGNLINGLISAVNTMNF